jgi:plasmid stabilization system protein ParE
MANLTIKLTETAYLDLEEIENYVSQSSPKIGREFVNKIFKKIEMLLESHRDGTSNSIVTKFFIAPLGPISK